ncbi:hypothetical protein D9M71_323520 [compost metagenome]
MPATGGEALLHASLAVFVGQLLYFAQQRPGLICLLTRELLDFHLDQVVDVASETVIVHATGHCRQRLAQGIDNAEHTGMSAEQAVGAAVVLHIAGRNGLAQHRKFSVGVNAPGLAFTHCQQAVDPRVVRRAAAGFFQGQSENVVELLKVIAGSMQRIEQRAQGRRRLVAPWQPGNKPLQHLLIITGAHHAQRPPRRLVLGIEQAIVYPVGSARPHLAANSIDFHECTLPGVVDLTVFKQPGQVEFDKVVTAAGVQFQGRHLTDFQGAGQVALGLQ